MTIMDTTTAGTKTITPTNRWLLALMFCAVALAVFSCINLTGRGTPSISLNDQIILELKTANNPSANQSPDVLSQLRQKQEQALAADPAEPFAWARLAWLRLVTQGDMPDAFAALRLSDLVSPGEPRQLPERALMWRQFS